MEHHCERCVRLFRHALQLSIGQVPPGVGSTTRVPAATQAALVGMSQIDVDHDAEYRATIGPTRILCCIIYNPEISI